MTQAAVSQQIKGLEPQLGCALFIRLPRGWSLPMQARAYIPGVRESIEKLALVTDEVFGKERSHTLTVRVIWSFLIPGWHRGWRIFAPSIRILICALPVISGVAGQDKEADIEIRYGKGVWPDLTSDRLTWDELIPVCSPVLLNDQYAPVRPRGS